MENQEEVWNNIAEPWKTFRNVRPIDEVVDFLKDKNGKILDLGCGSGRNFAKIDGTIYGADFSENMLKFAKEFADKKGFNVKLVKADTWNLPFEDNFFDSAICASVIHCIPTEEKREKALRELFRVLKPKAEAWISVWNRNQERFRNSERESLIPWEYDGKKHMRYYYLYDRKEFLEFLKKVGFEIIKVSDKETPDGFYSKRNIDVIVKKPFFQHNASGFRLQSLL